MKQRHYDICGVNYDEECDSGCTHIPSTQDVYTDFANAVGNDVLIENWHREEIRKAKEGAWDEARSICAGSYDCIGYLDYTNPYREDSARDH